MQSSNKCQDAVQFLFQLSAWKMEKALPPAHRSEKGGNRQKSFGHISMDRDSLSVTQKGFRCSRTNFLSSHAAYRRERVLFAVRKSVIYYPRSVKRIDRSTRFFFFIFQRLENSYNIRDSMKSLKRSSTQDMGKQEFWRAIPICYNSMINIP